MPSNRPRTTHRALVSREEWVWLPKLILPALLLIPSARAQLEPEPASVRVGVLSLFHPATLILTCPHPTTLLVDGAPRILDANHPATLRALGSALTVDEGHAQTLASSSASFALTVPGKLTRGYRGALTVTARNGILIAIVAMDTEQAVASIVAAESPPHAPLEALKAQAVAARSFLLANPRAHGDFDACDTTHCQFLRSAPDANSPAARATVATRHTVLTWRASPDAPPRIVSAMYSRSCGGQTRALADAPPDAYPFYSVRCDYCLRHPELWSRADTAAPATERQRLAFNRRHGWSAIPSNQAVSDGATLEGRGTGHGLGLCQLGASDLAARGATFGRILAHYYPNTTLSTLP